MPSASNTSNSSNIQSVSNLINVKQTAGSRLTVVLVKNRELISPLIEQGHVIRYDVSYGGYTLASATDAASSEVFGVVESKSEDGNTFLVVTYGSIKMDASKLLNIDAPTNYGGNDIYFLSTTPGFLQNINPTTAGQIIKPVYQVAPVDQYTGSVVNYVGYTVVNQG